MHKVSYRISPGIGIARLGNSQENYFIGPEAPGIVPDPGAGFYRDSSGRIKRQGARFRIYEMSTDEFGAERVVREITNEDATIIWHAHLVNRKAAGPLFPPNTAGSLRNTHITDRQNLVIDAGKQMISGVNRSTEPLSGTFKGTSVILGELRTDTNGRLIVLGGHGISQSVPAGRPLRNYANNPDWCDDVSDGPITATVKIGDKDFEAEAAWVVVAPPAYAPGIDNIMTWYDQALDISIRFFNPNAATERPSFTRDIYPILKRTVTLQWVSARARSAHGEGAFQDFMEAGKLQQLSDNGEATRSNREAIIRALAAPNTPATPNTLPPPSVMPKLQSGLDPDDLSKGTRTALTEYQYQLMEMWSRGDFDADWTGNASTPAPFDQIPLEKQPHALDRAALEACIGGPFFPGIESGYIMAQRTTYEQPFRIDQSLEPGTLTQGMAEPWQADFLACGRFWWPAQRPVSVKRTGQFVPYTPTNWGFSDMVQHWSELGFIIEDGDEYVEKERLLT